MDFKLRYHISKETDMEPDELIERILFQLNDKKYRIIDVTDRSVKFDVKLWRQMIRWNGKQIQVDGGEFEISTTDSGTMIGLNYYYDLLQTLTLITLCTVAAIIQGHYLILLFLPFYLINEIIYNRNIKREAKNILNEMATIPK